MHIRVRYFAALREIVGQSEEQLALPTDVTIADVRADLLTRHPGLQPVMDRCLCAVNHAYAPVETLLHDGDEVVFIPPMGGGIEYGL